VLSVATLPVALNQVIPVCFSLSGAGFAPAASKPALRIAWLTRYPGALFLLP
jgi:hypothetical protein